MTSVLQASLTGGEFAPSLWGRTDLARYGNSMKLLSNWLVRPYGGVQNRPGTTLVCEVKDSSKRVRLLPFQFSTEQAYVLEMGELYMRVVKDGGQVVYSSGGSAGQPVEISTPYTADELPDLNWTQSADVMTLTHQGHVPQQLGRTDHDAWTRTDFPFQLGPFQEINTDTAKSVYPDGTTGTVTIKATSAIFNQTQVGQLFYLEQKDYGTPWQVSSYVALGDIRRFNGKYYQAQNPGTTGTLPPSHSQDSASDGTVVWLYLHAGWGVARISTVAGDGLSCTAQVLSRLPDGAMVQAGVHPTTTVTAIAAAGDGNLSCTAVGHGFSATTTGKVTIAFTNTGGAQVLTGPFTISVIDADHLKINVLYSSLASPTFVSGTIVVGTSYKWALAAWGGDQGYPRAVSYYQQRQVFASTPAQPETFWLSRTSAYSDFSHSTPTEDDDAITRTLGATQVNAVLGVLPLDKLLFLTTGGVWAIGSGNDDVLTPGNTAAKQQGFRGSSSLPPLCIGDTGLYLLAKGRVVRDLGYELASDKFTGTDLTVMASHLVAKNTITEWTWHESPHGCVWAVRDDGVLLSCTYFREQQVVGWARHDLGGTVESVAVISEGSEDVLYLVVRRIIAGQTRRFIERMATRVITDIREAHFVDCGLQFDGRNTTSTTITLSGGTAWDESEPLNVVASAPIFVGAGDVGDALVFQEEDGTCHRLRILTVNSSTTATGILDKALPAEYQAMPRTDWAWARDTFPGLDHLEGETVAILADGGVETPQVVIGGRITLARPATLVSAGLPIIADLEPLPVAPQTQETVVDKRKTIPSVALRVWETRSIWMGADYDNLFEVQPDELPTFDAPPALQDGVVDVSIACTWSSDGSFVLRHSDPLPITILALIPDVVIGGKA